jgi:hypothetical protein
MYLHQYVFLLLWLASCGYAALRGGSPERITAVAFLLAAVISGLVVARTKAMYGTAEWGVIGVDLVLFLVLFGMAMWSCRYWPLIMTSLQGCELFGHLAKTLAPDIVAIVYFAIVTFLSFPMLALLFVATWRHRRRLARYGVDYAWVNQLPPAYRAGWTVQPRSDRRAA